MSPSDEVQGDFFAVDVEAMLAETARWADEGPQSKRRSRRTVIEIIGWVLVGGGFISVAIAYSQLRNEPQASLQIPFLASGGLFGLAAMIVGSLIVVLAQLRNFSERIVTTEVSRVVQNNDTNLGESV